MVAAVMEHARRYVAAGLSVIPVRADGSKAPKMGGWRTYTDRLPTDEELSEWFGSGVATGIGVVPGPASGNLVVLDFENKGGQCSYSEWLSTLPAELQPHLATCPVVRTPSGGRHVWVRLADPVPGGKLARYAKGTTKIEVRGLGHQVLAPGCPPECHASGEPYVFESEGWTVGGGVAPVPSEAWAGWVEHACSLNEYAAPERPTVSGWSGPTGKADDDAPGADFNRRGSWAETGLFEAGWSWVRKAGEERGLICRPDKEAGVSASIGMVTSKVNGWPLFWCWSTSVPEFVAEQGYSRFAVFAALRHGGDFKAAAKDLSARGYGNPPARVEIILPGQASSAPEPGAGPTPAADKMFKWMSELQFGAANDKWLWNGYLSRGGITLLSALWKAGKSTLLSHLIRAFDGRDAEFLGREITPSRVLYVSEEHEELWAERRDELHIGDHVGMICRPFQGRTSPALWAEWVGKLTGTVIEHRFDVVVIDTISKMWPVREENDAGQVEDAMMPLWTLTKQGVALMVVHHTRKSGGEQFTESRGSGGLPAFCETLMTFCRTSDDLRSPHRKIKGMGRYRETPVEWYVELTKAGYVSHGDPQEMTPEVKAKIVIDKARETGWGDRVFAVLPDAVPGLTVNEINDRLRKDAVGAGVRDEDLASWLKSKCEGGELLEHGTGVKGNPLRYYRVAADDSVPGSLLGE